MTLACITFDLSVNHAKFIQKVKEENDDYQATLEWFIGLAEDFEKKHAKTDWEEKDWYEETDKFINKVVKEYQFF